MRIENYKKKKTILNIKIWGQAWLRLHNPNNNSNYIS